MPTSMIQCTRSSHGESLVDIDFSQGMIAVANCPRQNEQDLRLNERTQCCKEEFVIIVEKWKSRRRREGKRELYREVNTGKSSGCRNACAAYT